MEVSERLIIAVAILVVIAIPVWICLSNHSFDGVVLFITLLVLIFYTYYTLRVVKFSYSGPALLHVREIHSQKLKSFFSVDGGSIHYNKDPKSSSHRSEILNYAKIYEKFEKEWEFKDLMNHHLPKEIKNLKDTWSSFKQKSNELNEACLNIFSQIEKDLHNEVERQPANLRCKQKCGDFEEIIGRIYYNIFNPEKKQPLFEVSQENLEKYCLKLPGHQGILSGSKDDMDRAKVELDKFASDEYIMNYKDRVKDIREKAELVAPIYKEWLDSKQVLSRYPILPGTDCDILSNFDSEIKIIR